MSKINNVPKNTDDQRINDLRAAFAYRARWMGLILNEVEAAGGDWETIGRKAISKCGCFNGQNFRNKMTVPSLLELPTYVGASNAEKIFEIEYLEKSEDKYYMNFHYCPLVAGWQMHGFSDEKIKAFCDIAMDGDRGMASAFSDKFTFTLGKTIADGHHCCELRFDRIKD